MCSSLDSDAAALSVDGVLTLAALRGLGATRSALAHRVRHGTLLRPHREVYVVAAKVVDPVRTSARAALAAAPDGAVASHLLAGHLYHLAGLPPLEHPEVTLPSTQCHRRIEGLVIHRRRAPEVVERGGLRVTPALRILADLAGQLTAPALLASTDAALRLRLVDPQQLAALGTASPATEAGRLLRRLMPLADGRSESTLESGMRLLLLEAGLGPLALQVEVVVDGRRYRIDLGFPALKVGIEADGRAFHTLPDALLSDRWRQNALLSASWLLLRFTWDDVFRRPEYVVTTVRLALAARSAA